MTTTASGSFFISVQQNDAFARLSGDYNPLHVDPVYARRLQFGHPVIHGVHHLLRAWDEALKILPLATETLVTKVSAGFQSPAQVDKTIDFNCTVSAKDRLELSASSEGKQILSLVITLADVAEAAGAQPSCAQLETGSLRKKRLWNRTFRLRRQRVSCRCILIWQLRGICSPNWSMCCRHAGSRRF